MIKTIRIKRVYDLPGRSDGARILVDRMWPRGVSKNDAKISAWAKDVAPSHGLRRWFDHDEKKFDEFRARYFAELENNKDAIGDILSLDTVTITLIYAAKDPKVNHAVCLRDYLVENILKK